MTLARRPVLGTFPGEMDGKMITLQVRLKKGKGFPRPSGHQRVYGQATVNGEVSSAVLSTFPAHSERISVCCQDAWIEITGRC
jgi:hypothetical protein